MTQECPSCGRVSEFQDGVCSGCGEGLDASGRRPVAPTHRAGGPRRRRSRLVLGLTAMAAVIVIVIVAVGGSSSDNSPSSAAVASAPPLSTADDGDATDPDDLFTATGANGKTYSCSSSVVGQVDAAHDVVTSREAVLRQRRAAVRRLERRYPSGGAPSAVIRRYAELVRRANAQIRFANQAIREYNGLLVSLCEE